MTDQFDLLGLAMTRIPKAMNRVLREENLPISNTMQTVFLRSLLTEEAPSPVLRLALEMCIARLELDESFVF